MRCSVCFHGAGLEKDKHGRCKICAARGKVPATAPKKSAPKKAESEKA